MEKTQGYIVALSSIGAQLRFPGASDGCISKHAVNRLVEFVVLGEKNPSSYPRSFQVRFRETDDFKKQLQNYRTQSTRASARSRWHQARSLHASQPKRVPLVTGAWAPPTRLRSPLRPCSILLPAVLTGFLDGSYTVHLAGCFPLICFRLFFGRQVLLFELGYGGGGTGLEGRDSSKGRTVE